MRGSEGIVRGSEGIVLNLNQFESVSPYTVSAERRGDSVQGF